MAIAAPEWFERSAEAAGLEVRMYLDAGWARHQDVYALALAGG